MDWIAEQLFTLVKDIQTGNLQNNEQVPALVIVIIAFGLFLARKQIGDWLTTVTQNIKKFFQVKKYESEIDDERKRIKQILNQVEKHVHELDRKKIIFRDEKDRALNAIQSIRADIRDDIERQIVPGLKVNRAEQIRQDPIQLADDIMAEVEARDNR